MHGVKQNRNLKIVRDHQKVEPIAFYQQSETNTTSKRLTGETKNHISFKLKRNENHRNNQKFYNSTILLKTPHEKSNDASISCEHHNLSARTLEAKGSFTNLPRKLSKGRKRSIKRKMNQTTSIEAKSSKRTPPSTERNQQIPLFIKRKINKPVISNVYTTNVSNLRSRGLQNAEQQATPSNRMHTSRHYKKNDKFSLL